MGLPDPTGRLITELRDDPGVSAITTRIRGGEPAPGDAKGAGSYQPFVVLVRLAVTRLRRAPVQQVRYVARCYGATFQGAAALAGVVSDAIHAKGHRLTAGGISIFGSFDDGGGEATRDPETAQPYETVVIAVNASTQLIS